MMSGLWSIIADLNKLRTDIKLRPVTSEGVEAMDLIEDAIAKLTKARSLIQTMQTKQAAQ